MSKKLVAYFSASGIAAKVAENLADSIGADLCVRVERKSSIQVLILIGQTKSLEVALR